MAFSAIARELRRILLAHFAQSFWTQDLAHLTKELPKFETVVDELRGKLGFLQE